MNKFVFKSLLFLQGIPGPFFYELAEEFKKNKLNVYKVHFNYADKYFWKSKDNVFECHSKLIDLPIYFQSLFEKLHITDLVVMNDAWDIHQIAIKEAKSKFINIWVIENGYFRPHWITLEKNGVNGFSCIKKNFLSGKANSMLYEEKRENMNSTVYFQVVYHIAYYIFCFLFKKRYPNYTHRRDLNVFVDAYYWVKKTLLSPMQFIMDTLNTSKLYSNNSNFIFFPLQMNTDTQIKVHSNFDSMKHAIHHVLSSFAKNRRSNQCLVIKNHPLDNGMYGYKKYIKEITKSLNISSEVIYIEKGKFIKILKKCDAMVTVNSTSGLVALSCKIPVISIGNSIYDLDGLTFQGGLDLFWRYYEQAGEPQKIKQFKHFIMKNSQINGCLFNKKGRQLAIPQIVKRIMFDI